jgi:hypothetical protein
MKMSYWISLSSKNPVVDLQLKFMYPDQKHIYLH